MPPTESTFVFALATTPCQIIQPLTLPRPGKHSNHCREPLVILLSWGME